MATADALCAHCGELTAPDRCAGCDSDPRLEGRYLLLSVLGEGASGVTYRAKDEQTDERVAVKELGLRPGLDRKALELASREADVLRQLYHPKIPRYRDDFIVGDKKHRCQVLVQDLVEGRDLGRVLEDHRFTEAEVLDLLDEILEILEYLQSLSPPVLHRDIKPKNIIRREDGAHVLVDFGSVRDVMKDSDLGGSTVAGTFGYMAPEQLVGDATCASDLYSLGATAVHLLTRKAPHSLLGPDNRMRWTEHARIRAGVRAFIDRLLEPNANRRPADAVRARVELEVARTEVPEPRALTGPSSNALARRPEGSNLLRGAPLSLEFEQMLERPVSPDHFGEAASILERHLGVPGDPSAVGKALRWKSSFGQPVQVSLTPAGGGARLEINQRFDQLSGSYFGGLVGGIGGGVGGGLSFLAARVLGLPGVLIWVLGVLGFAYVLARTLYRRAVEDRRADIERQLPTLIEELEALSEREDG